MYIPHLSRQNDVHSNSTNHDFDVADYHGLGPHPEVFIDASFAVLTVGQAALILLGATVLLYHRGDSTHIAARANLLLIAILCSVPPYFLMYGGAIWLQKPPFGLCVTQAALMDGSLILFASASLALAFDFMTAMQVWHPPARVAKYFHISLVAIPYTLFLGFFLIAIALGMSSPDQVQRMPNELSYSLRNTTFINATQSTVVLTMTTTLCLEGYTLRTLRTLNSDLRPSLLCTSQAVRIVGFSFLLAFFLLVSALDTYVDCPELHIASIVSQALMPLGTFAIFGLTEDNMKTWRRLLKLPKFPRLGLIPSCPWAPSSTPVSTTSPVQVKITIEKYWNDAPDRPIHIEFPTTPSRRER